MKNESGKFSRPAGTVFLWLMFTLMLPVILLPAAAKADAGFVRFRSAQGSFVVTVFSPFEICRSTPTDISVMVQRNDTGETMLDATVELHLIAPEKAVIHADEMICGSGNATMSRAFRGTKDGALIVEALRTGPAKFLYAAPLVSFPVSGDWQLEVSVQEGGQAVNIATPLRVEPPGSSLGSLWFYLALPPLCVALFLINQWLTRRCA